MKEIMKYDVRRVVYVERDPALSKTAIMDDNEVYPVPVVENDDAFSYVRNKRKVRCSDNASPASFFTLAEQVLYF